MMEGCNIEQDTCNNAHLQDKVKITSEAAVSFMHALIMFQSSIITPCRLLRLPFWTLHYKHQLLPNNGCHNE